MYDDEYNRKVAGKVRQRSARNAVHIDRLNGAGSNDGAQAEDRKEYPASHWFEQENEVFRDDITRPDVQPASVVRARSNLDLGAGRYSGGSGMVGFPERAPISAIEPAGVVRQRANLDLGAGRSGAGFMDKLKKGLSIANKAGEAFLPENSKLRKGLDIADQTGQVFGQGQGMSGGFWGALLGALAPPLIAHFTGQGKGQKMMPFVKEVAMDYLNGKLKKGEMTKRLRAGMGHGMKRNAPKISAAIVRLSKSKMGRGYSGSGQFADDDDFEFDEDNMVGGALPLHMSGCGDVQMSMADRQVGGQQCCSKCAKCKCGRGRSGAGMSGGYGPVAPTTESMYGYDNRAQPKGMKPPPSVNQQPGMCGGASGGATLRSGRRTTPKPNCSFPAATCRGTQKYRGGAEQPVSLQQMGRNLIPVNQLPSGVGGGMTAGMMCPQHMDPVTDPETGKSYQNKCKMAAAKRGGRAMANTTNYASNSGSIIPSMQSRVSIGSGGARAARGAMVAKLMKEKGMSLGEASKALKGGAYSANDFFQPKNIHQFFGAYA